MCCEAFWSKGAWSQVRSGDFSRFWGKEQIGEMDPITLLALALAGGLVQVAAKLLEKGFVEPALEPATERLKKWLQRGYRRAERDQAL